MSSVSGPRTFPTVKHLATMNNKNLRHWEFHLGIIQAVVLTGLAMGAVVCAFFVGYVAGHNKGFEGAMASNVSSVARLPIADEPQAPSRREESQMLARLSGATDAAPVEPAQPSVEEKPRALPDLSFARLDSEEKPQAVVDQGAAEAEKKIEAAAGSLQAAKSGAAADSAAAPGNGVRVLGQGSLPQPQVATAGDGGKTLGTLLPQRDDAVKVEAVAGEAAAEPAPVAAAAEKVRKEAVVAATVAPEPTIKPAAKAVDSARAKVQRGWFAQVAAPNKKADADALVRKLKSSGFNVVVESAKVRGEEYFRVLVGPEETRSMAEQLVLQLNREAYIDGAPFVRMVK